LCLLQLFPAVAMLHVGANNRGIPSCNNYNLP
jgi:hypothetical protein